MVPFYLVVTFKWRQQNKERDRERGMERGRTEGEREEQRESCEFNEPEQAGRHEI